jgi:hypothetical protein
MYLLNYSNNRIQLTIGLTIFACCMPAFGGGGGDIPCGSAAGIVREFSAVPANFTVRITQPGGAIMNPQPPGFPVTVAGTPINGGLNGYGATVNIPRFGFACDVKNTTQILPKKKRAALAQAAALASDGGEVSDLMLEALSVNAGQFQSQDLFGTITSFLGSDVEVEIPDLYADTNGDGSLDSGDVLYSLVDMSIYLQSAPAFSIGDTYSVVNGRVAGLPGMQFSTTEFTFDPATGFTGTDYTGMAEAETLHALQSTPEPGSIVLTLCALASVAWYGKRQRSQAKPRLIQ